MELHSRATDYIWEGCSNQRFRCEVNDETAVVADTAICGRMNAFTHVILGVAKMPSMGALPLW
jgi:hypothetical protein